MSEAPLAPAEPAHGVVPPVLAEVVDLPESPQKIPPTTGLPLPAPALPEVQVEAVAAVAEVGEDEWGRYRQDASRTRAAPYHVGHGGTRMREVEATEATPALQLALNACSHQFVPWQLRDRHDVYVSHDHRVQPGEILRFTHVAEVEGISLPLAFVMPPVSEVHLLLRPAVTCRERARLLCRQQARLADDQIAYALRELRAKLDTPLAVLEPAHLLAAVQQRKDTVLRELLAPIRLAANFVVVSALPLGGHWVTFAWVCDADRVAAWNSYAIRQWDDMISTANWLLSHALQRSLDQYRFLDGPVRPLHGPHCGQFALDDLDCFVRGVPFRQDAAILRHYAQLPAGLLPPSNAGLVPLPTCIASGQDLLEAGLATTLRTRGVPEGQARARAVAAIQALGAGRLQQAMQSKAPWKELKALANQASPIFQLVLPSELELAVKAKSADGRPIQSKRKQRQPPPFAVQTSRKQHACLPALDSLCIPTGVFTSSVGDLEHLPPSAIGPTATGVVILGVEEALPYTQVSRPVSSSALGLLVPGPQDVDGATLPGVRLRFTAKLLATGEPVLLSASLFQLGCVEACKYQPQQVATVEITPSVVAKFTLFRDEALIDWQEVVRAPVKALLDGMPQLRTCRQVGCGCNQWHGTSGPGEPQALLEIWGRAFQKHTAKPELPAAAAQFVVFLRLPASLLPTVLAASGVAGIYCEPREPVQRLTSADFKVVWLSKVSLADARLLRQTHTEVVGLARVGDRHGLRCAAKDEEALHNHIRPDIPFLPQGARFVYHSGPWPPGTQKGAITKLLSSIQWRARAVQPLPGNDGHGAWWVLHAASPPAQTVVHTQEGELLLVEQKAKTSVMPVPPPAMVAARATLQSFRPHALVDPLTVADPWAEAAAARHRAPPGLGPLASLESVQEMKAEVEKAVLSKVRKEPLDSEVSADVAASVERSILAKLRPQLQDATSSAQQALHKVQHLEGTVQEVARKVDSQEHSLRELFSEQMSKIEELLGGKRQRQE